MEPKKTSSRVKQTLDWWRYDAPPQTKGLVVLAFLACLFMLSVLGSHWRSAAAEARIIETPQSQSKTVERQSSPPTLRIAPPTLASNRAMLREALETRPSNESRSEVPQPGISARKSELGLFSSLSFLRQPHSAKSESTSTPKESKASSTNAAHNLPLQPGDVFRGTAGPGAKSFVDFVCLEIDQEHNTVLFTGCIRDMPIFCSFRGTIAPSGIMTLEAERSIVSGAIITPAAIDLFKGWTGTLTLRFDEDDPDKLTGQRLNQKISLTRDPEASKQAKANLLNDPLKKLQFRKLRGLAEYQSVHGREKLPVELWFGEMPHDGDLNTMLAILSIDGGHRSWRIWLKGTIPADGVSIGFSEVHGVNQGSIGGNVGEFIELGRGDVQIKLTFDGKIIGTRRGFNFTLEPIEGIHKPTVPKARSRSSRR